MSMSEIFAWEKNISCEKNIYIFLISNQAVISKLNNTKILNIINKYYSLLIAFRIYTF